jgi:hydroxymethylpyrimidine/phosphomethylpyrimidine kinase
MVLAFAASDPTGGAGLQADLLTLASMGCHPLSVVTALTVQDTSGVEQMQAVDPEWVARQARVVLAETRVAAFKLGVLGSARNAAAVAAVISEHPEVPVVFDPVLASGRGDPLAGEDMIAAFRELILPQCTVATPNSLEARRLAAKPDLADCARRMLEMGCEYVLITGTHEADEEVVNTLYDTGGVVRQDRWQRLPGSYHGSGCTLASALAAALANGQKPAEAARGAQEFTWQALAGGFKPGKGQLIPDRFFWAREPGSGR